jgi:pilus assembly protein Flp/PilA
MNLRKFLKNEDGATAIEYSLIAALIAVVIIGAVSSLGGQISTTFGEIEDAMVADEPAAE